MTASQKDKSNPDGLENQQVALVETLVNSF